MTTTLRERRKQALRDEILHAVGNLLAEKGFAGMSMDEIAAHVGISKPTLYSHFTTKEDLIVATLKQRMEWSLQELRSHTNLSPLQRLTHLLQWIIERQLEKGALSPRPWNPEMFQMLCAHEESLAVMRQLDEAITDLVKRGMALGEINASLDVAMVVRAFYAMIGTLHITPFSSSGTPDPRSAARTVVELFTRGVQSNPQP